jgi:hypothetical protein
MATAQNCCKHDFESYCASALKDHKVEIKAPGEGLVLKCCDGIKSENKCPQITFVSPDGDCLITYPMMSKSSELPQNGIGETVAVSDELVKRVNADKIMVKVVDVSELQTPNPIDSKYKYVVMLLSVKDGGARTLGTMNLTEEGLKNKDKYIDAYFNSIRYI